MRLPCTDPWLLALLLLGFSPALVQASCDAHKPAAACSKPIEASPAAQVVTLPAAVLGRPYARQLPALGGAEPLRCLLLSGDLEDSGLLLSADGRLSGAPTRAGSFSFRVAALSDADGGRAATQRFSLTVLAVAPARPVIPPELRAQRRSKRQPK